jgi:divalent metal cation (Fe/Co/Zn/Cd) transporter
MKTKMKYLDHLQYLSAILTVAMLCIQGATALYGAVDATIENHHAESQPLVDHLTNDQLNNMTVSDLKELNLEVKQELKQKLNQQQ